MMEDARRHGINQVCDICHFGYPDVRILTTEPLVHFTHSRGGGLQKRP